MNIYRKRKHHIWAVVISKKHALSLFFIILSLIFTTTLIKLPENVREGILSPIARISLKEKLFLKAGKKSDFKIPKPDAKNIVRISSPVFSAGNISDDKIEVSNTDKITDSNVKIQKGVSDVKSNERDDKIEITNATSYKVDTKELLSKPVSYMAHENKTRILIVHTHGCETYSDKNGASLGKDGYRTTDKEKNVTAVGKILARELESVGVSVIYDDTLCDYPSYNSSYKNSMALIENYKSRYPDIAFVFDIHRDAISDDNGDPVKLCLKHGDDLYAQIMIVCGTDASGLYHPNWRNNLILGLKIQEKLEKKLPGITRPLNLREERFNMHETPGSLIFEIGTHANTLSEAKKSAVLLANAIYEVICN